MPTSSPPMQSRPCSSRELPGAVVQLPLRVQRGDRRAVGQVDGAREGQVVGDLPEGRDRLSRQEVPGQPVVLDHRQHQRGGADLQEGGDLGQVGVAHDHVEPAVLLRVGVGLVTGVDDRALQRRLEADLLLEEVGALRELVRHVGAGEPGGLRAHLAGPGVDLPGDEVRHHVADDLRERDRTVHQVVLVGAVAVALAVGVVLVDDDLLARGQELGGGRHRSVEDQLGRPVVHHDRSRVGALRGRQLRVGVVDVVPGAVGEHGVDEVRLHLGWHLAFRVEAAGIVARLLVLEVPADPRGTRRRARSREPLHVGVDQDRGGGDRVRIAPADDDPVLGLDPEDLLDRHRVDPTAPLSSIQPAPSGAGTVPRDDLGGHVGLRGGGQHDERRRASEPGHALVALARRGA